MCGILSIITNTEIDEGMLNKLISSISHRGPDASGVVIYNIGYNKKLVLGHTRLSIIDLSQRANQPFVTKNCILSFNGEIYNYKDLRLDLEAKGIEFATNSDTEVLVKAYDHWGDDFLSKLNGMFAFTIWDAKRRKLIVARDRFGEKPLFWAMLPHGGVIFASEMKVILGHKEFHAQLAFERLQNYIEKGWSLTRDHQTPFKNIFQVEPASAFIVNDEGIIEKRWKYWVPNFSPDPDQQSKAVAVKKFYDIFEDSVLKRAACDVQIGACLSGGLDSTSIVGILNKHKPSNFHSTISVRFNDDPTISEGKYIDLATRMFNHRHQMITPKVEDFINDAAQIHWHHEMPLPSISMFLEWSVMKTAKEMGNTVMLDGQGADELLGGYPYYFPYYQKEALFHGEFYKLFHNTRIFQSKILREAKKYSDFERRINLNTYMTFSKTISICMKESIKALFREKMVTSKNNKDFSFLNPFRKLLAEGLESTSLQEQLHSADRNGMAFGIETRFPFLDYNLVDYCIKLSRNILVQEGYQKYILRKAIEGLIPVKITSRTDKLGFQAPQDKWSKGSLSPWIQERISDSLLTKLPFYSLKSQPFNTSSWQTNWRWASLAEWLSVFKVKLI